ncbi:MAG: hypothetical protein ACKN99_08645, partial [Gemmatimonadota bacterium]
MTRLRTILALVLLSGCGRMGLQPLVAPTAVSAPTASDAVPMLSPQAVAAVPAGEGAPVVFVDAEPVVVTGAESVGEAGGSAVDIDEAASNP